MEIQGNDAAKAAENQGSGKAQEKRDIAPPPPPEKKDEAENDPKGQKPENGAEIPTGKPQDAENEAAEFLATPAPEKADQIIEAKVAEATAKANEEGQAETAAPNQEPDGAVIEADAPPMQDVAKLQNVDLQKPVVAELTDIQKPDSAEKAAEQIKNLEVPATLKAAAPAALNQTELQSFAPQTPQVESKLATDPQNVAVADLALDLP